MMMTLDDVPRQLPQWLGYVVKVPCAPKFDVLNQSKDPPLPYSSWGVEEKDAFEHWCAPLMDRWFPGWRGE